mmetsp:Transcript_155159/g.476619  ORF Transcript_155159/g.476619 Transcript_155159/m.476619 type:complete len:134 (-) Transcript_155159:129-530(-)
MPGRPGPNAWRSTALAVASGGATNTGGAAAGCAEGGGAACASGLRRTGEGSRADGWRTAAVGTGTGTVGTAWRPLSARPRAGEALGEAGRPDAVATGAPVEATLVVATGATGIVASRLLLAVAMLTTGGSKLG